MKVSEHRRGEVRNERSPEERNEPGIDPKAPQMKVSEHRRGEVRNEHSPEERNEPRIDR